MRNQLRDYTQNLEQLVRNKTKQLVEAERLAAVGQTVAGLSHAIKNIVGGLKGGTFVLEKGLELDNQKYLLQGWEMVKGNVDKITNLSLDLLNYSKIIESNYQLCDPNRPVREVVDLMGFQAKENGIELQIDLSPHVKPFYFDPDLVHRCLLNLVSNAFDACMEDDSDKNSKTVIVKTLRSEGWGVEYQVVDNGSGMATEVKNKVFKRFFSTKGTNGTGIGLMLTKKIVDDLNGVLEVDSQEGAGSTFTIKIPKALETDEA
jgi:signal transduction histidine kinase